MANLFLPGNNDHHARALAIVREVIADWDPYALLAKGAPDDEFDAEVASLVAQFPRINSRIDAAHAVSRVFLSAFGPERFSREQCALVGSKLFERLRDAGFVGR